MIRFPAMLVAFILCIGLKAQVKNVETELILMGSRFGITVVSENQSLGWSAVNAAITEIERIEALISSWDPTSQTSEINSQAGIRPVKVSGELFRLIERSLKVSRLTDGAFDISFASINRLYNFDKAEHSLPDSELVDRSIESVGWDNIILNKDSLSVFLAKPGMKIAFGAIGKGYAADMARLKIQHMPGILGGIVNASGDLTVWGNNLEDSPNWKLSITRPDDKDVSLANLELTNTSIVTSGDYEKYFTHEGQRYAHIIDPKTGWPVKGISSVSVICSSTELADALATSVFVLGLEKGLALLNRLEGVEGLIVTADNQLHTSDQLTINYY